MEPRMKAEANEDEKNVSAEQNKPSEEELKIKRTSKVNPISTPF